VNLSLPRELAAAYKSGSQQARVVTESWGATNFFCPSCPSNTLEITPKGFRAIDYFCPKCRVPFQLKSKSSRVGEMIADGAYETMLQAIKEDRTPNLYVLQYDKVAWTVVNLFLIPHFAFPPSAIIKRNALSVNARRAGWVGCWISITNIPKEARISIVEDGLITSRENVRERFRKLKPLKDLTVKERGWTLDVLRVVQSIGKPEFSNQDVYAFALQLERLHPENHHPRDKIRQQLQFLRDRGFLKQLSWGRWQML